MKKHYHEVFGYYQSQLEIETLAALAVGKESCMEVGSYIGKSAIAMAIGAKKVLCIDTFEASADVFDDNGNLLQTGNCLQAFLDNTKEYDNISYLKGRSEELIPALEDASFDLIFLDGDHSYEGVWRDIVCCWPKLKIGGILTFHDYVDENEFEPGEAWGTTEGVGRAYREFFNRYDGRQTSLVWIVKTKENTHDC